MLQRQQLSDVWSSRLKEFNDGYWITLNSRMHVNGRYDSVIPDRFIKLDHMVCKYVQQINQYCYGRRYLRREPDAKLIYLVSYEVGDADGLIHCHMVAAHNGSTTRTVEEIKRVSDRKWSGLCQTKGRSEFVFVENIKNIDDRIWYMTKQSEQHQRLFGDFNLTLY